MAARSSRLGKADALTATRLAQLALLALSVPLLGFGAVGCEHSDASQPTAGGAHSTNAAAASVPAAGNASAASSAVAATMPIQPSAGSSALLISTASASASAGLDPDALAGMNEPPLFGPDGQLLPQTEELPSLESPAFKERLDNLFRAIQQDDPEIARSFFFPVQAYEKVKAIDKAAADWSWRLFGRFKRDIKKYHKALGDNAGEAKLVKIELRRKPKWMKPGSEGNRIGYHRVTRSWLHYETADGTAKHLEITSMISWRGEWYVVHLDGFK